MVVPVIVGALLRSAAKGAVKSSVKKAAKNTVKKKPTKGKAYTLKNTTKARVKLAVQGSRAILAYKDLAKAAATGENTKIMRGIRRLYAGNADDGENLKEGIVAMVKRIGGDTDQLQIIENMDERILASMYDSNDITFEVFFNYEGVTKVGGDKYIVSDEKKKDIDWFIEQYNKVEMAGLRDIYANDMI